MNKDERREDRNEAINAQRNKGRKNEEQNPHEPFTNRTFKASWFDSRQESRDNVYTDSGTHSASHSSVTGFVPKG